MWHWLLHRGIGSAICERALPALEEPGFAPIDRGSNQVYSESEVQALMGETLSDLPAGLVSSPFFARIFFMYETVRMQKSGVTQGR